MGGSQWTSTGPYQKDLESAFRQAQEQELAKDDHGFPGRDIVDLWDDDDWREYILTGGTSSVLDFAMMRPLTESEVRDWAPEGSPTRERWVMALRTWALSFPGRHPARPAFEDEAVQAEAGVWGRSPQGDAGIQHSPARQLRVMKKSGAAPRALALRLTEC